MVKYANSTGTYTVEYITTEGTYEDSNIAEILKASDLLFVDTETTGVTRRDTMCLLQIKAGDTVFIVKVNTLPDAVFAAIMDAMEACIEKSRNM